MIIEYKGKAPQISASAFVAPTAVIIGDVTIGDEASIWWGAVIRSDQNQNPIRVGARTSIQDNCVLHSGEAPTIIEDDCTIGHGAIMEGPLIKRGAIIGMNVTLLENVGLKPQDLEQVILAGAFGNFINIDNAIVIGLLPDLPREQFQFVGNGSLMGATLLAFSRDLLGEERRVASMMTNFELSETPGFMNQYIAALFLPHTQKEYFPSVFQRLRTQKGQIIRGGG